MEINIKDKLKNISGEKIKGSLMHELGIGKIAIIIVCGIIILAGSFFDGVSKSDSTSDDVGSVEDNRLSEDEALNIMNIYAARQEKKLKKLLESMDGVGDVNVMVTLASSEEKIALKDTERGESKGKNSSDVSEKNQNVIISNNGDENPYVVSVTSPKIAGVAIVCEGADGGKKDSEIIDMVGALFGIESHKIKVTKMD
ncbi:hypothetical protein KQI69_08505 [Eubacterium sp. MSJ-13]|uniref:hypothetical protein n=1 Tax=Eubacterium sp. MSJ-13 TaxID=2841513 RepID=UPI001C111EBF|nr:hypothetical protein [Eubacterium sp. MSJ-13]MBU5479243.1 hypothetical protein [Eubacterium sp. MSJ-13]